ncbi:Y-family DNA polymerase [Carnobacterium divergens]|nr:Y-family DNA polymerase [Carnobacterium divergens]SBO17498.1 lesion bypass phage DNA polymerase [Carnobacterium divergens]
MELDYSNEPRSDMLCIDIKSFYASVECVERGLDPLKTMLVVMSNAESNGGLILASSPAAKKQLGISNVMRKFDLPHHPQLIIVPPRMSLYIEKNKQIIAIFRKYAAEEDILVYSIDEAFLKITPVKKLFHATPYELARKIQYDVYHQLGLYTTIGIGDNPLLAKLALDNEAKDAPDFKAEWRYHNVADKVWRIPSLTDMWGIGSQTAKKLIQMNIHSVYDLAHFDPGILKEKMGIIGEQLYAHSWGIDRSDISVKYKSLEKSYSNSQILLKDYTIQKEIELVIKEMADQVATRLRKKNCQTQCISLFIRYSNHEVTKGFNRQLKITATNNTKQLIEHCLTLFRNYYKDESVRQIGISCSKLVYRTDIQLDLFKEINEQVNEYHLDTVVDKVRTKYGFNSLIHASSLLEGATAIKRSSLVGGHASGKEERHAK